jgi:hypothetical protein
MKTTIYMNEQLTIKTENLNVVLTGNRRKIWRVCTPPDANGTQDEFTFRMQGILTFANIIPGDLNK